MSWLVYGTFKQNSKLWLAIGSLEAFIYYKVTLLLLDTISDVSDKYLVAVRSARCECNI